MDALPETFEKRVYIPRHGFAVNLFPFGANSMEYNLFVGAIEQLQKGPPLNSPSFV
jgi:hypothetical protein